MTNNFDLIKNYMINEGIPMKEKDMGGSFLLCYAYSSWKGSSRTSGS